MTENICICLMIVILAFLAIVMAFNAGRSIQVGDFKDEAEYELFMDRVRDIIDECENVLELMDEAGDSLPGGQSDRVFARYEFDGLRKTLEAYYAVE